MKIFHFVYLERKRKVRDDLTDDLRIFYKPKHNKRKPAKKFK